MTRKYFIQADAAAVELKEPLKEFSDSMGELVKHLAAFGDTLTDLDEEDVEAGEKYKSALSESLKSWSCFRESKDLTLKSIDKHAKWMRSAKLSTNKQHHDAHDRLELVTAQIRSLRKHAEATVKSAGYCYRVATQQLSATKSVIWKTTELRVLNKSLLRMPKESEDQNIRSRLLDAFALTPYFERQLQWLQTRFPNAEYNDVEGLCKSATRHSIEQADWSLMPGNFVGVTPAIEEDEFEYGERMEYLHEEIDRLASLSSDLTTEMQEAFKALVL